MDIRELWKRLPRRYATIALFSLIIIVIILSTLFKGSKNNENKPKDSTSVSKETNLVIHDTVFLNPFELQQKIDSLKLRIAEERENRKSGKKHK